MAIQRALAQRYMGRVPTHLQQGVSGNAWGCEQNALPLDIAQGQTQCNGPMLVGGNWCLISGSGRDQTPTWNTDGAQVGVPSDVIQAARQYLDINGASGGQPKARNVRDSTGRTWSLIAIYSTSGNSMFSGTSYMTVFVVLCTNSIPRPAPAPTPVTSVHLHPYKPKPRVLPQRLRFGPSPIRSFLHGVPMITYKVQPGDSPTSIAGKLAGNPQRMRELILANPQKHWAPTGLQGLGALTFHSLQVGETLNIPASWGVGRGLAQGTCWDGSDPDPNTGMCPPGPTPPGGGGSYTCPDGTVVSDPSQCPPYQPAGNAKVLCPDGVTWVDDISQCPSSGPSGGPGQGGGGIIPGTQGGCPPGQVYDPNGNCVPNVPPPGGGGGPRPPPAPAPPPAPPSDTTQGSWIPWIVGAVAVAAGVGAMMWFTRRGRGPSALPASPTGPKLLPRHATRRAGRRRPSRSRRSSRRGRRR